MTTISLSRILTCSALDYVGSVGKSLSDYSMVGIHSTYRTCLDNTGGFSQDDLWDAEVVVDYRIAPVLYDTYAERTDENGLYIGPKMIHVVSGTKLIPRGKNDK